MLPSSFFKVKFKTSNAFVDETVFADLADLADLGFPVTIPARELPIKFDPGTINPS